jgi:C_GCAxxG_C_C family probable redox protein
LPGKIERRLRVMDQTMLRIMELDYNGYYCSQILLILALEAQGKSDPDLVRVMGGLAHGLGTGNGTCGTLSGAACLLSLYAGKGSDQEYEDENLRHMLRDLCDWFDQTFGKRYGNVTCDAIVGDRTEMRQRCGEVVAETYRKALEILVAAGYDITVGR